MKHQLESLLTDAVDSLCSDGSLPDDIKPEIHLERTRDRSHGDFATNLAMTLCKAAKSRPRDLAEKIVAAIPASDQVERIDIAGPGFINFSLTPAAWHQVISTILDAGDHYGRSDIGEDRPLQVEFVSANPTGPLHVGHGRGAAYGATVADLLETVGYRVHREYYVNDAGRQMDILAASVYLRYLDLAGVEAPFPSNGYQGDYVWDIGATLHRSHGDNWVMPVATLLAGVPADDPDGGDKEAHIDGLIANLKQQLGDERYRAVFDAGLNEILANIRQDLKEFGI